MHKMYYQNEVDFLKEVQKGIRFKEREDELPTLPDGYTWDSDSGGVRLPNMPLT